MNVSVWTLLENFKSADLENIDIECRQKNNVKYTFGHFWVTKILMLEKIQNFSNRTIF